MAGFGTKHPGSTPGLASHQKKPNKKVKTHEKTDTI